MLNYKFLIPFVMFGLCLMAGGLYASYKMAQVIIYMNVKPECIELSKED